MQIIFFTKISLTENPEIEVTPREKSKFNHIVINLNLNLN